jgi:hypothetical protein
MKQYTITIRQVRTLTVRTSAETNAEAEDYADDEADNVDEGDPRWKSISVDVHDVQITRKLGDRS